jgi:tetratricopeptide (TPR) repeat protein
LRSIIAIGLLLLGSGGLWVSISWLQADQYYRKALFTMEALSHIGDMEEQLQWQSAKRNLNNAAKLRPSVPEFDYRLGKLFAHRAAHPYARERQKVQDRSQALQYYRSAVDRRPTWSSAWASLAYLYALSMREDAQTIRTYERAVQLAGLDHHARRQNAITGMIVWDSIDAVSRARVEQEIRKLLNTPKEAASLIRDAAGTGWIEKLRPLGEEVFGVSGFNKRLERIK